MSNCCHAFSSCPSGIFSNLTYHFSFSFYFCTDKSESIFFNHFVNWATEICGGDCQLTLLQRSGFFTIYLPPINTLKWSVVQSCLLNLFLGLSVWNNRMGLANDVKKLLCWQRQTDSTVVCTFNVDIPMSWTDFKVLLSSAYCTVCPCILLCYGVAIN